MLTSLSGFFEAKLSPALTKYSLNLLLISLVSDIELPFPTKQSGSSGFFFSKFLHVYASDALKRIVVSYNTRHKT